MSDAVTKQNLIIIRGHIEDDLPFIFSTWLKGNRHGMPYFEAIDSDIYFRHMHRQIEAILDTPGVYVNVACLKEDPGVIIGYAVFKGSRLDWVFVKKRWRKIGIAKDLIPTDVKTVSHLTDLGKSLLPKLPHGVIFDPYNVS